MLRNNEGGFGMITIVLHWTIALLILGLILAGFIMRRTDIDPTLQFSLYQWHKSFGFTVLGLALLRTIWWLVERSPHPVLGLRPLEHVAARATHATLVLLCIVTPLAGWAVASASTLNIPSFFFDLIVIPHFPLAQSEASEAFWALIHAWLAYVVLGLVAIHAAAALYHHFIRRDEVLTRMLRSDSRSRRTGTYTSRGHDAVARRNDP
jgi:cytochrome b561